MLPREALLTARLSHLHLRIPSRPDTTTTGRSSLEKSARFRRDRQSYCGIGTINLGLYKSSSARPVSFEVLPASAPQPPPCTYPPTSVRCGAALISVLQDPGCLA